ncbi:MAG: DUF4366 domain-containing protein [Oscillospiraceae bacterium]|jgi:hypothetical protein|nr:DUF4366 domain-containing protein [Oscillospiraceae bacterium]
MTRIKALISALTLALALTAGAFLLSATALATDDTTPTPPETTAPAVTETAISDGENAFTPPGGGTVLDNASEANGKEFFTITATDGSVYYLIIDRRRGTENVYFLSAVTKEDLLGLAQSSGTVSVPGLTAPEPTAPTAAPTAPVPTDTPTEPPRQTEKSGGIGTIVFIIIAAAAAGGAAYYFKIAKPKKHAALQDDEKEYYEAAEEDGEDEDAGYFFAEEDADKRGDE